MQTHGYMILRFAGALVAEYEASDFANQSREPLAMLRRTMSFINPHSYRGISRQPLAPYPTLDPNKLQHLEPPELIGVNAEARAKFLEIVGDPAYSQEHNEDSLPTLAAAREVYSKLERPEDYEIVLVERTPGRSKPDLGYDIGYWAGDHFSLICDTLVMPVWHPPQPEDFSALAELARNLNPHMLFPTAGEASAFRDFYLSRSWAETEDRPGEFCVVSLSSCSWGA